MTILFSFIIVGLIAACTCFNEDNIFAIVGGDYAKLRVMKETMKILSNFKWNDNLKYTDVWQYKEPDSAYDGYIRLKEFTVNNITIDILNTSVLMGSNNITVSGKNEINITYNFNYNSKTGVSKSNTGAGFIQITSKSFNFTKRDVLPKDGIHSLLGSLNIDLEVIGNINSNVDNTTLNYFNSVVSIMKNPLIRSTQEDLQRSIDAYYDFQSKAIISHLVVQSFMPEDNKYDISFKVRKDPYYIEDKIIYYYSTNVTKTNATKADRPSKLNAETNLLGNNTTSPLQIFFLYEIIRPIIEDISNSSNFYFNIRDNNLPASINFLEMNINYLGEIIPGIYNERVRDEKVMITANVYELSVNNITALNGTCMVEFRVLAEDGFTDLLTWVSSFRYSLSPYFDLEGIDINFRLKAVHLLGSYIKKNRYGEANIELLEEWIQKAIDNYIGKENSFNLFKKPIDLSLFFSSINNLEYVLDGINIGGTPDEVPLLTKILQREFLNKIRKSSLTK